MRADHVVDQCPLSFPNLLLLSSYQPRKWIFRSVPSRWNRNRAFTKSTALSLINMALLVPRRLGIVGQCLCSFNRQAPGALAKGTGLGRGLRSCLLTGSWVRLMLLGPWVGSPLGAASFESKPSVSINTVSCVRHCLLRTASLRLDKGLPGDTAGFRISQQIPSPRAAVQWLKCREEDKEGQRRRANTGRPEHKPSAASGHSWPGPPPAPGRQVPLLPHLPGLWWTEARGLFPSSGLWITRALPQGHRHSFKFQL